MSDNDEPADLAGFRGRREELKRERRRNKARDNFTPYAPDYGREIPPRLNPDVPDLVDRVKACYVGLTQWITGFQQEIGELADAGKLDRAAEVGLLEHYRDLQEAVDAATADALSWHPVAGVRDFTGRGKSPPGMFRPIQAGSDLPSVRCYGVDRNNPLPGQHRYIPD